MNNVLKMVGLIVMALSFSSCGNDEPEESSLSFELPSFDKIQVNSYFHLYLKQDTVFSIHMVGDESLIDDVRFSVENGVLYLTHESDKLWRMPSDHEVKLYISSDQLKQIVVKETCFIETINPITTHEFGIIEGYRYFEARLELACNIFYFWNGSPCGGKLTLEGNVNYLRIWNYINMSVDAINLNADNAMVENHSTGDCMVRVMETLEYGIYGKGNIYLYGEPNQIILKEKTSTGELIRVE